MKNKITREWLIENGAFTEHLNYFENYLYEDDATNIVIKCISNDEFEFAKWILLKLIYSFTYLDIVKILSHCGELGLHKFAKWIMNLVPPTSPPYSTTNTEFDELKNNFISLEKVINVRENACISKIMYIRNHINIQGELTNGDFNTYISALNLKANKINLNDSAKINSGFLKANSIHLKDSSCIEAVDIKANTITLQGNAKIIGRVKAKTVIFSKGGNVEGTVEADEIINSGGFISEYVFTKKLFLTGKAKIGKSIYFNGELL